MFHAPLAALHFHQRKKQAIRLAFSLQKSHDERISIKSPIFLKSMEDTTYTIRFHRLFVLQVQHYLPSSFR